MIIKTEQPDGSTLVQDTETGRTFRFPSTSEQLRRMSEAELDYDIHMGSATDRLDAIREYARRGDEHYIKVVAGEEL